MSQSCEGVVDVGQQVGSVSPLFSDVPSPSPSHSQHAFSQKKFQPSPMANSFSPLVIAPNPNHRPHKRAFSPSFDAESKDASGGGEWEREDRNVRQRRSANVPELANRLPEIEFPTEKDNESEWRRKFMLLAQTQHDQESNIMQNAQTPLALIKWLKDSDYLLGDLKTNCARLFLCLSANTKLLTTELFENTNSFLQAQDLYVSIATRTRTLFKAMTTGDRFVFKDNTSAACLAKKRFEAIIDKLSRVFLDYAMKEPSCSTDLDQMVKTALLVRENAQLSGPDPIAVQEVGGQERKDTAFFEAFVTLLNKCKDASVTKMNGQVWQKVSDMAYELYGASAGLPKDEQGTIGAFVSRMTSHESDPTLFRQVNQVPHMIENICKKLMTIDDKRFPTMKRYRYWHAFKNGIYCAKTRRFYDYRWSSFASLRMKNPNHVAVNYHPYVFELDKYAYLMLRKEPVVTDVFKQMLDAPNDLFMHLRTPLDRILDTQKFGAEECKWLWAELGALLHQRRDTVLWNHIPFYVGMGGTGKTVLMITGSKFYSQLDVFQFNTVDEGKFATAEMPKSEIFMAFDIARGNNIDSSLWLRIADSQMMKFPQKNRTAIMDWVRQFGMVASNDFFDLPNSNGQMTRRMLLHMFREFPDQVDDLLESLCEEAMPIIMMKANSAIYWLNCKVRNGSSINQQMPESMHNNRRDMEIQTNPVKGFLYSPHVTRGPDYYVDLTRFQTELKNYTNKSTQLRQVDFNHTSCARIIKDMGLSIRVETRINPANKKPQTVCYVFGVTLTDFVTTWPEVQRLQDAHVRQAAIAALHIAQPNHQAPPN